MKPPTSAEIDSACSHYAGEMDWSDEPEAKRKDAVAWLKAWIKVRDEPAAGERE